VRGGRDEREDDELQLHRENRIIYLRATGVSEDETAVRATADDRATRVRACDGRATHQL